MLYDHIKEEIYYGFIRNSTKLLTAVLLIVTLLVIGIGKISVTVHFHVDKPEKACSSL